MMLEKNLHRFDFLLPPPLPDSTSLPIVRPSNEIVSVISQLDVLVWMRPQIFTHAFSSKTLGELRVGTRGVISIVQTAPASDAFALLKVHSPPSSARSLPSQLSFRRSASLALLLSITMVPSLAT